jgi:hypothetical protein
MFDTGIDRDPAVVTEWHKAVISATERNPEAVVKDKACMGGYLFGIKNTLYKYELYIYQFKNANNIQPASKLPFIKTKLTNYIGFMSAGASEGVDPNKNQTAYFINYLVWSAVIPISIFAVYGLLAIKNRMFGTGTYVFLMTANIAFLLVLVPAASFRYIYAIYPTVILLPGLYLLEKNKLQKIK